MNKYQREKSKGEAFRTPAGKQRLEGENRIMPGRLAHSHVRTEADGTTSPARHADLLSHVRANGTVHAHELVHRMQRRYGNRHVQHVIEIARQGQGETEVDDEVEQTINRKRGGGQGLDSKVKTQMESAMDADFSGVRIHTDGEADSLNRRLNAKAFTTGEDIFFRSGEYQPGRASGRELIAHELTHVIQQNSGLHRKMTVGRPDDIYEKEADETAHRIINNENRASTMQGSVEQGARQADSEDYEEEAFLQTRPCSDELAEPAMQRKVRFARIDSVGYSRLQADFAVTPTTPTRAVRVLSAAEIQDAIAYNRARHRDADEIGLLRDILGIAATPRVIDADFVNAVVRYQARYGLQRDGKLGRHTADRLAREIIAEANFLGGGNLGSLAPEFALKTALRNLISANNRTYAVYKSTILGATMLQQHVALRDQQLLRDLRNQLSWNNWARCIELLGRRAPSGNRMRRNSAVRAALAAAWAASNPAVTIWPNHNPAHAGNPCNPPPAGAPPTTAHEEGGFIYMNLITGRLTTRSVPSGGQAALVLAAPPAVNDSIVVGGYHTHPNVGNCWGAPFFSGADIAWAASNGVPILMRGAFPGVANTTDLATGIARRHLAGNRGLPGAGGGLAPQSPVVGDFDEL